ISGEALLKELKLKQLPVIVLSAKDAIDDRVALLNEGADDYLCKPFDLKELKARIQVQLRKRMPQQEHEIAVD
ncbi:response regulator, partial [[Clostridium] scindens]